MVGDAGPPLIIDHSSTLPNPQIYTTFDLSFFSRYGARPSERPLPLSLNSGYKPVELHHGIDFSMVFGRRPR